jgi:hypothetical protein
MVHAGLEMKPDARDQLNLRRLPGKVTVEQAAVELGFHDHEIPILIGARMLKPLGNPVRNSVKYFAGVDVRKKAEDVAWMDKATAAVQRYWKK